MRERQLRRIFQRALALASVGTTAAACSPSTEAQPPPGPTSPVVAVQPQHPASTAENPTPSGSAAAPLPPATPQLYPAPSICADPATANPLANLQPHVPVDYVEVRRVGAGRGKVAPGSTPVYRAGHRCGGADANSACEQAYATLDLKNGFVSNCIQLQCSHHVIYTTGGELKVISSKEDLQKFVGPIDSKGEALLWVWANDFDGPDCDAIAKGGLTETKKGFEVAVTKLISDCPWTTHSYRVLVARDGAISVVRDLGEKKSSMCAGRMPPSFTSSWRGEDNHAFDTLDGSCREVAEHLAEMAFLESAAVVAFEQLVMELEAHHAPAHLIEAARAAVEDETSHTASITALAEAHGARVMQAYAQGLSPRPFLEMALDNAREGCVRETFGALLGQYQAQHSEWPAFANTMHTVAADEFRHAAFSWQLADWLDTQLDEAQRQAVANARRQAAATLVAEQSELAANESRALSALLGRPAQAEALALATSLLEGLWVDAA